MIDHQFIEGSVLVTAWRHAQCRRGFPELRRSLRASAMGQWVGTVNRRGAAVWHRSASHSRTYGVAGWVRTAVGNSWLYGWLTAEPEAEVVVIDLRETKTVGPVLGVLDRVFAPFVARTSSIASRLRSSFATDPVRMLAFVVTGIIVSLFVLLADAEAPLAVLVALAVLANLALLCIRIRIPADQLATPVSVRLLGRLVTPPEIPDGETAEDAGHTESPEQSDQSEERQSPENSDQPGDTEQPSTDEDE